MKKYQIIGGQYSYIFYGESDSLHGAKCIAARNKEFWGNYQGWHKPLIFNSADCFFYNGKPIPRENAEPVA